MNRTNVSAPAYQPDRPRYPLHRPTKQRLDRPNTFTSARIEPGTILAPPPASTKWPHGIFDLLPDHLGQIASLTAADSSLRDTAEALAISLHETRKRAAELRAVVAALDAAMGESYRAIFRRWEIDLLGPVVSRPVLNRGTVSGTTARNESGPAMPITQPSEAYNMSRLESWHYQEAKYHAEFDGLRRYGLRQRGEFDGLQVDVQGQFAASRLAADCAAFDRF